MSFVWPLALLALLAVPLLVVAYRWLLRRRRGHAVVVADLGLVRQALPKRARWRRHLPPALLGLALCGLFLAAARPHAVMQVPLSRTSIILALDVSRSMCATDVEPNRLTVAQQAAVQFVEDQADGTRIGIVAFAGVADLVVPPTNDRQLLIDAIERFNTSFGTAIGSATLRSVDAVAEVNDSVPPTAVDLDELADPPAGRDDPVPDIVVLLTDGANSQGVDPIRAAEMAAERGVRVFTIGFGTTEPTSMVCNPSQAGADFIIDPFGAGSGGVGVAGDFGQTRAAVTGFRQYLVIDEPTLQTMAELTGAGYYRAEDATQLTDVFRELPTQIELQDEQVEITVWFVGAATLLALAAMVLSMRWSRFP